MTLGRDREIHFWFKLWGTFWPYESQGVRGVLLVGATDRVFLT